ncbi:MAG: SDR family oxidoreductase [Candidatus Promineifilaceae bacterium]|nr:SDR family oxidoreductase [Candidatus Promineifilaceae bacterium]
MTAGDVVLITGASAGIGRACATLLLERGYKVYGTSRSPEAVSPPPCHLVTMAADDPASVAAAVEQVLAQSGRIDALINNVGFSLTGPLEEIPLASAKQMFAVNYWSAVQLSQQVLPAMRARGTGAIVNISSVAADMPLPFQGHYSASKAALSAFTAALRMEVGHSGVRVTVVEAGNVQTDSRANRQVVHAPDSDYRSVVQRALKAINREERDGIPADRVARLVARILASDNPRPRYVIGHRLEGLAPWLKALLPDRLGEWALRQRYGLP